MKPALLVLLLGLLAGLAAHAGWYAWRKPAAPTDPEAVFAWMQSDLQLDAAQLARIRALHERTGPQVQALAHQAARMRAELESFETIRRTDGRVDFLAFARSVEAWRALDRSCLETTRRLIAATAGELTPAQRDRYLAHVTPPPARPVN